MARRGLLLFGAMCVIWGIPYLLILVAVRDLSPAVLVLARTAIAALLLLPLAAARGELRPLAGHWVPLLVFAAIEIAIPWVLLGTAEQHISSSLTALLIAAVPLVGAVIARTTGDRERPEQRAGRSTQPETPSDDATWSAPTTSLVERESDRSRGGPQSHVPRSRETPQEPHVLRLRCMRGSSGTDG